MDYTKIKVLHSDEEVNQYLVQGWKIIKIFAVDSYVVGFPSRSN